MTGPALIRVSDHALVRFLDRAGGLDVETVREHLAVSLGRAALAADRIGLASYVIVADGLRYVVDNGTLVTVLVEPKPGRRAER